FSGYVTIPTPSTINVYETKSINQLEVRWENINKNTSYNLYRSSTNFAEYSTNDISEYDSVESFLTAKGFSEVASEIDTNNYLDTDVEYGENYCYVVASKYDDIISTPSTKSNTIEVSIPTPSNFVAKYNTTTKEVSINWSEIKDATSYTLYKDGAKVIDTTDLNYTDSDIDLGTTSVYSLEVNSGSVKSAKKYYEFEARTYLYASQGVFDDKIELKWDAIEGVSNYKVTYRRADSTSSSSPYVNTTDTNISITNITNNYAYEIVVSDDSNSSDKTIEAIGYSGSTDLITMDSFSNTIYDTEFDSLGNRYTVDKYGNLYKTEQNGTRTTVTSNNVGVDIAIDSENNIYTFKETTTTNDGKTKYTIYKKDANSSVFESIDTSLYDVAGISTNGTNWYVTAEVLNTSGDKWSGKQLIKNGTAQYSIDELVSSVRSIFVDGSENLYISDSSNGEVYKFNATGTSSTVIATNISCPDVMTQDDAGNIYVADDYSNYIYKIDSSLTKTKVRYQNGIGSLLIKNGSLYTSSYSTFYKVILEESDKSIDNITVSKNILGTENQINISWDRVDDIKNYQLYRSKDTNDNYELYIDDLIYSSYTDTNISTGTQYYYKVLPEFYEIEGELSDEAYGIVGTSSVSNLVATKGEDTDTITLTWSSSSSSSSIGYDIYRSTQEDGQYTLIKSNHDTVSYEDSYDLLSNQYYYYKIKSNLFGTQSEFSQIDSGYLEPVSPSNLTISGTINSINLTWDSIAGVSTYKIYRKDSTYGTYSYLADVNSTSYSDTSVNYLDTKYYKVVTEFENTESDFSQDGYDYVSGSAKVAAPQNLTASQGTNSSQIDIAWDANTNADSYTLYRATSEEGTYSAISSDTTSLTYADTSASSDTVYYYKIKSKYDGTEGDFSEAVYGYYGTVVLTETFSSGYSTPYAIAIDSKDNVYIVDIGNYTIYKVTPTGTKTEFSTGYSYPSAIAIDSSDTLYVSDISTDIIYQVTSTGEKTEFSTGYSSPYALAIDSNDNLYVADDGYDTVYKVTPSGEKTEYSTGYYTPYALAIGSDDSLYVSDVGYDIVYKVTTSGDKSEYSSGYDSAYAITIDSNDNLFVSDDYYNTVYKVTTSGDKIVFVTGYYYPYGIAVDSNDSIYLNDDSTNKVYKITEFKSE
ncbi:MAG: hypothetical protein U9O56_06980, partial [Campylobacterota bacterium]|nr:hypothetical protein [Campylobacterota bacterium]